MGNAISKSNPTVDEKLVGKLQAMTIPSKSDHDGDYVYLEKEACRLRPSALSIDCLTSFPASNAERMAYTQNISVSTFEQWEKKLLQDPKVL